MGAGRHNHGGLQKVEAIPPILCELLDLGRSFCFATPYEVLNVTFGRETILAIQNGNDYPLLINSCSFAISGAGTVNVDLTLNPSVHNAPTPYAPIALNRVKPQGFHGTAFRSDGTDTAGPTGGALLFQGSVQNGQSVFEVPPFLLAPNDLVIVAASITASLAGVSTTVVGHHIS